jgi:hypothetical protein
MPMSTKCQESEKKITINVTQPDDIICFKIKNPPTLHSTSKIQPTTSPTFVFSVFANVGKSGVMKENC